MSVLRAYRGLVSNGPLVRLLGGEFISSIGDWLYLVALLIVVYQTSSDPLLLGVVGAARILPYVLLSYPAGIVADRFERRMVLLVTDCARGVIMLGLAGPRRRGRAAVGDRRAGRPGDLLLVLLRSDDRRLPADAGP